MLKEKSIQWLQQDVLPLWTNKGVDWENGGFFEAFTFEGTPQDIPRRCMVQARQIYSLRICSELNLCDKDLSAKAIHQGIQSLVKKYSLSNGSFAHAADAKGNITDATPDLYAQAFALFGLANAYRLEPRPELKQRALEFIKYLETERKLPQGGYSELQNGQTVYEANPHMHMFESALSWMEIDSAPEWKELADSLMNLALTKFIDPATGALAEHFNSDWTPIRANGNFVFEPGHHYEWAWLMGLYQKYTGKDLTSVRKKLVDIAETTGIHTERKSVIDEVWSDGKAKLTTSRFWPQCERIKVLLQLALEDSTQKNFYLQKADEALTALFNFFETPRKGLWFDIWQDDGEFKIQPAKASSLYHITGALTDYIKFR